MASSLLLLPRPNTSSHLHYSCSVGRTDGRKEGRKKDEEEGPSLPSSSSLPLSPCQCHTTYPLERERDAALPAPHPFSPLGSYAVVVLPVSSTIIKDFLPFSLSSPFLSLFSSFSRRAWMVAWSGRRFLPFPFRLSKRKEGRGSPPPFHAQKRWGATTAYYWYTKRGDPLVVARHSRCTTKSRGKRSGGWGRRWFSSSAVLSSQRTHAHAEFAKRRCLEFLSSWKAMAENRV